MAQISGNDSKLNTDLNLVPFIDLLSTLVLFLLVTAVWLQVSVIPANTSGTTGTVAQASQVEMVNVQVESSGVTVKWPASTGLPEQTLSGDEFSKSLREGFHKFPTLRVGLSANDSIDYAVVVGVIDTLRDAGFDNVGLSTE